MNKEATISNTEINRLSTPNVEIAAIINFSHSPNFESYELIPILPEESLIEQFSNDSSNMTRNFP